MTRMPFVSSRGQGKLKNKHPITINLLNSIISYPLLSIAYPRSLITYPLSPIANFLSLLLFTSTDMPQSYYHKKLAHIQFVFSYRNQCLHYSSFYFCYQTMFACFHLL